MKTKHVTIKENESLINLAARCKDAIENTTDFLLSKLFEYELVDDIPEECGILLKDHLIAQMVSLETFIFSAYKTPFDGLLEIFKGIQIWGLYDCPDCGCELKYKETRTNIEPKWKECPNCGFELYTGSEYDPDEKRDSLINCCLN